MVYVALLRGINVGGKNKVEMAKLKTTFERAGLKNVKTYINSGNIIFEYNQRPKAELTTLLEKIIETGFGFKVKVLIRDFDNIKTIVGALPDDWQNNKTMKCDILFLWDKFDQADVLENLTIKPEIDDVKYVGGAILWRVDKDKLTKSGLMKIVGTELYKNMTIRNCNTLRKLFELMK